MDFSKMPIKEGVDAEGNPIYKIGQGNNVYRDPIVELLNPVARNIGKTTLEGTILGDQAKLLDYANGITDTPLFKNATESKQTDFNNALTELQKQLNGVTDIKTMKNYYDLLTSANRLKEAIYYLDKTSLYLLLHKLFEGHHKTKKQNLTRLSLLLYY